MVNRVTFFLKRIRERLWVRPLVMCIVSVIAVFVVKLADNGEPPEFIPELSAETIETLLKIMASSMLVIATFSVGSMVAAYASAGSTATPRSFPLVVSDDVSQNALSSFIGAFIFSIVSLIALMNGYYETGGRFALFCFTLFVFIVVILTFLRWVDCIARLGRLGNTIDRVEKATTEAFKKRMHAPNLGGVPAKGIPEGSQSIYGDKVGYVQRIEMTQLQAFAEKEEVELVLTSLPGTFSAPGQALAHLIQNEKKLKDLDLNKVISAFKIGHDRTFDEDPRFGLVALSEVANRALSPAVNDPGTAIDIIGTFVRLFMIWDRTVEEEDECKTEYDRVHVPELEIDDMFEDAFMGIARNGANSVEVGVRLQKAFHALTLANQTNIQEAAKKQSKLALQRAEDSISFTKDLQTLNKLNKLVLEENEKA